MALLLEQSTCRPTSEQAGGGVGGGGGDDGCDCVPVPPAGSRVRTVLSSGATHRPLWHDPALQGVPAAFGLIFPALQLFFPFFRSHLPFLQVSHSPGFRLHLPELEADT